MPKDMEIIDRGWIAIKRQVRLADKSHTKVGLQEGAQAKDLSDLVTIGAVNEFGAPKRNIPERPFIRTTFDDQRFNLNQMIDREYDRLLRGTTNVRIALGKVGAFLKGKTQQKIVDIDQPPNKPSTIRRKGSSNPLIDTGQMRQSIRHVEVLIA